MKLDGHIITLTIDQLEQLIRSCVRKELELIHADKPREKLPDQKEMLLTRFEVAEIFKVSTVSLDKWKRAGILPKPVKMAGKVYYLKEEILKLIEKRKVR